MAFPNQPVILDPLADGRWQTKKHPKLGGVLFEKTGIEVSLKPEGDSVKINIT